MCKFFILGKFLTENPQGMPLTSKDDSNNVSLVGFPTQELKITTNIRKLKIYYILDRKLAFITYMTAVSEKFQHQSHELINYLGTIQDAARYQRSFM